MTWYGNSARLRTDNILHCSFLQCDTRTLRNRSRTVSRYSSVPTFIARGTHFIETKIHRFYAFPMDILEFLSRELIGRQILLYLRSCPVHVDTVSPLFVQLMRTDYYKIVNS